MGGREGWGNLTHSSDRYEWHQKGCGFLGCLKSGHRFLSIMASSRFVLSFETGKIPMNITFSAFHDEKKKCKTSCKLHESWQLKQ